MRLLITFLLACWPLAAVDLIWFAGCETGDLTAEFALNAGASCNATRVLNGNYSLDIASGNAETPDLGAMSELWVRLDCNIDIVPPPAFETALKIRSAPAGGQQASKNVINSLI